MFDTELAYFIANQKSLVKKYRGKTVVLKGASVVGAYDTMFEAYLESNKKFVPGTFMLQFCQPGDGAFSFAISPAAALE